MSKVGVDYGGIYTAGLPVMQDQGQYTLWLVFKQKQGEGEGCGKVGIWSCM